MSRGEASLTRSARSALGFLSASGCALLLLFTQLAQASPATGMMLERVIIVGGARTRDETLLDLLPRRPPAEYTDEELLEFERRVNNLAIFDEVTVVLRGRELHIAIREKWTLIPSVEFSSGETLEDSRALIGLTEFNLLGSANQLSVAVSREQRGWGATVSFDEHSYRRHRWSFGAELSYSTWEARFEDGSHWRLAFATGSVGFTSPRWLNDHLAYRVGAWATRESVTDVVGPVVSAPAA